MLSQSLRALLEFLEGRGEVFIEDVPPDLRRLLPACYGPKWVMRKIRPPEWASPSNWTPLDGGQEIVWLTGLGTLALAEVAVDDQRPGDKAGGGQGGTATVAARMIDLLRDPRTHTWSARQFADKLGCAKSTVAETAAFRELRTAREMARLQRAAEKQEKHQRKRE